LQNFDGIPKPRQSQDLTLAGEAPPGTENRIDAIAGGDWTHYGTNPNSSNELLFEK